MGLSLKLRLILASVVGSAALQLCVGAQGKLFGVYHQVRPPPEVRVPMVTTKDADCHDVISGTPTAPMINGVRLRQFLRVP